MDDPSTTPALRRHYHGQIAEAKHRPLRELNPDTPEWLAEMIDELLAKKPEDRYQSAADVAEVLEYAWTRMRT